MSLNIFDPNLSVVELKYLIGKGVNVDVRNKRETPLMHHYNSLDKVKLLVEAGADVNHVDGNGQNILFRPLSTEVLEYLIENGADVSISDNRNETALMHHYKSLDKVQLLVEAGVDLNNNNVLFKKDLPFEVLKFLIEAGINVTGDDWFLPLMSHIHSLEKYKLLIDASALE